MYAVVNREPEVDLEALRTVELASRQGDGLEVKLLWTPITGRVRVEVSHVETGESVEIDADPAQALEVYYHPFAFYLPAAA